MSQIKIHQDLPKESSHIEKNNSEKLFLCFYADLPLGQRSEVLVPPSFHLGGYFLPGQGIRPADQRPNIPQRTEVLNQDILTYVQYDEQPIIIGQKQGKLWETSCSRPGTHQDHLFITNLEEKKIDFSKTEKPGTHVLEAK